MDCEEYPVLPAELAGRLAETLPLPAETLAAVPVLRPLVFSFLIEGVVLTTDERFAVEVEPAVTVLPVDALPDETLPDACARLALVLLVLLFLLTVLLVPIPPLRDEPLPNTLSAPVWCLEPYHTSLWSGFPPMWPGPCP